MAVADPYSRMYISSPLNFSSCVSSGMPSDTSGSFKYLFWCHKRMNQVLNCLCKIYSHSKAQNNTPCLRSRHSYPCLLASKGVSSTSLTNVLANSISLERPHCLQKEIGPIPARQAIQSHLIHCVVFTGTLTYDS